MLFKGLCRAEGSSPGHLVTVSLTLSLSLFLPFSLFSHPSFFATLLFPSFLSLYPLLFPNLFCFFLPIFFSVSPFLTSFLYLAAFLDSFLLRSSPFQSLALSLSLHLSLLSFFTFFFFLFFSFFCFYFCLGEAPPQGFFCNEQALYIVYSLKAPLFKRISFF